MKMTRLMAKRTWEIKIDNSEFPSEDSFGEGTSDDREKKIIEGQNLSSENNNTKVVEEDISTVNRREGLCSNRPVIFDHMYDHTMSIVMTKMSVGKGIKKFGEKAVDVVTNEFTQLDEKGVLLPRKFSELTQEQKTEALPAILLIKEKTRSYQGTCMR